MLFETLSFQRLKLMLKLKIDKKNIQSVDKPYGETFNKRGDKWPLKNHVSRKIFIEFHSSCTLIFFSSYVFLTVLIFCKTNKAPIVFYKWRLNILDTLKKKHFEVSVVQLKKSKFFGLQ